MGDDVLIAKLDALRDRFEDERDANAERHSENVARLGRIEDQVRQTNGRVTRAEEQIKTLFGRVKALAVRFGVDGHTLTIPTVGRWIAIIGGTLAGGWFVLIQLLGYHR